MDFNETYAHLLSRAPENQIEPRLEPVVRLCELLGDPQNSYPVIHVTGTNGKTSTSRIIETLLREHHLRVGRYTSPHLVSVAERISLGGEPVDEATFTRVWEEIAPFVEIVDAELAGRGENKVTFFEAVTVLAFAVFADAPVDVAVVEVGLGGAWDATNVVQSQVAVFTSIDLDHTELLGDRVEDIALEKAGIIKPTSQVVSSAQEPEAAQVILDAARERGVEPWFEPLNFAVARRIPGVGGQAVSVTGLAGEYDDLFLPLLGAHQAHNAALALAAVEAFLGGGKKPLRQDIVEEALAQVTSPGRAELLRATPPILADAAHNPAGVRSLRATVEESFDFSRTVGLVGILEGKDARGMLAALEPFLDDIVVTASTSPRSIEPERLGELAADAFGEDRVHVVPSLPDAVEKAVELADDTPDMAGGVVAAGSITLVAELSVLLGRAEAAEEG